MDKKILFGSDYDGTFRRYGATPEPSDIEAVKRFREAGGIFGIVTGRTPSEMTFVIEQFSELCDFLLCATGGVCLFPDGTMAFISETTSEDLPELYRISRECGAKHCHSDAMSLTGFATMEELHDAFPGEGADEQYFINGYVGGRPCNVCVTPEAMKYIKGFTQYTSYFEGNEGSLRTIDAINAAFPGKYKCHYLGVGFDMTPAYVNKTRGLALVADHFGIPHEDIYTAGDGWNDVDMLKAYNGISMSGTAKEIMESAKWVYDSVGEAIQALFNV